MAEQLDTLINKGFPTSELEGQECKTQEGERVRIGSMMGEVAWCEVLEQEDEAELPFRASDLTLIGTLHHSQVG